MRSISRPSTRSRGNSEAFCSRQAVTEALQHKRIALVGSGPGVLDNARGLVDSHDVVVRVNNYKLNAAAGYRTDIFYSFFGTSIKKSSDELRRDGVYLCICKCPNSKPIESEWHVRNDKINGIDFRYIYQIRAGWWFCPTYVPSNEEFLKFFELLQRHIPTTGFNALLDILSCSPASVYMTGFDFFESGIHNVNEPWRQKNNEDPIGHRPDLEKVWLKQNLKNYPISLDARLQALMVD